MLSSCKLLLPALIPSWRFFDVIAPSPRIEFALLEHAQNTANDWQELRPRPATLSIGTMLKRLFWNPEWNESLFLVSCAERLMAHPTEHSIQEILTRIRAELKPRFTDTTIFRYVQFRLVFLSREGKEIRRDITFVSPIHASFETAHA